MKNTVVRGADILLPTEAVAAEKWAVVAVDQYTSEPEYWREAEEIVGDAPSTLHITLPEVYLAEGEARTPEMQKNMRAYLEDGVLEKKVENGETERKNRSTEEATVRRRQEEKGKEETEAE